MKKFMRTMLAIALTATMIAPMSAFADEEITDWYTKDSLSAPIDVSDLTENYQRAKVSVDTGASPIVNKTANTKLSFSMDEFYIVTIPETIALSDDEEETTNSTGTPGDEVFTGKGKITVNELHLNIGYRLNVGIDATNKFQLQAKASDTHGDVDVNLQYGVAKTKIEDISKSLTATDGAIFEKLAPKKASEGVVSEQDLYFITDEVATAGNYEGTLIFSLKPVVLTS